jgi:type II secretory pathway component PulC
MKYVKLILRNINVLNMLLLATAIFLFFEFDYPLLKKQVSVAQIEAKEVAIQNEEKIAPENSASYADFVSIAEKNLFHPEREIPKAEKAAMPKPELILYGTLITDDVSIAYVEDKKSPYSTPGRAKRQTALKKGGSIGGYVLREIEPNRIVLVKGEDKLVVMLDDNEKRKGSETASSQASKGVAGAFPSTSSVPASPQVMTPPAGAAMFPSPAQSADRQSPGSPGLTRSQTLDMIRNLKSQRGATSQ